MPDFNKIIEEYKENRNENLNNPNSIDDAQERRAQIMEKIRNVNKPKFTGDSDAISDATNTEAIKAKSREQYTNQYAPDQNYNSYQPTTDLNAKGVDYVYDDFATKVDKSLGGDFGNIIVIVFIVLLSFLLLRILSKKK